jgi:UDP-N-acetylglucosamine 2-epimerase (non-hydrolysing)
MSPKVVQVIGTRPNFIKMRSVIEALGTHNDITQLIVHTGQHYDRRLSDAILADLSFPQPNVHLGIGGGTHGYQMGHTIVAFERVLVDEEPDLVIVAGDVNATLACALAAAKALIPVAHVESGLRSRDWTMPEELNRVLTDRISTLLFTHSPEAEENLAAEGINRDRVHYIGNTMIDSLRRHVAMAVRRAAWRTYSLTRHAYVLITLHRPSNVDHADQLEHIVDAVCELAQRVQVVFPIHPRTRRLLTETGAQARLDGAGIRCCDPLGYVDFLSLETTAGAILTDSGGVQEEASALGVRCYTLRPNTERPITVSHGTNTLLGDDPAAILDVQPTGRPPVPCSIPLWDGHAGERAAQIIANAVHHGRVLEAAWTH